MISCGICLSLSDLTSLSMIIARSIHVAANGIISSFMVEPYSIVCVCVCVCIHTPHLCPFICRWTLRLFPAFLLGQLHYKVASIIGKRNSGGGNFGWEAMHSVWDVSERLFLSYERHQDSLPLEERNSILGQWWGLLAQSFCVIKFN